MKNPFRRTELHWPYEYMQLATYNAERLRGLLHTPQWIDYMADVQERYNREQRELYPDAIWVDGVVIRSDGSVT